MELIAKAFPALLIIAGIFSTLAVGGIISDYILKRSHRLNKFIDNLPMNWD